MIYCHSYKSTRAIKLDSARKRKAKNVNVGALYNCEDAPCGDYLQSMYSKMLSHTEGKLQYIPHIRKAESGFRSINEYYNGTKAIDIENRQRFAYLPPNVRPLSYVLWMLVLDEPKIIGNVTITSKVVR